MFKLIWIVLHVSPLCPVLSLFLTNLPGGLFQRCEVSGSSSKEQDDDQEEEEEDDREEKPQKKPAAHKTKGMKRPAGKGEDEETEPLGFKGKKDDDNDDGSGQSGGDDAKKKNVPKRIASHPNPRRMASHTRATRRRLRRVRNMTWTLKTSLGVSLRVERGL